MGSIPFGSIILSVMATIKIKFRPSSVPGKEGKIFFQLIHQRVVRQIHTGYCVYPNEIREKPFEILVSASDQTRYVYLEELRKQVVSDLHHLERIVAALQGTQRVFSADQIVALYRRSSSASFFAFAQTVVEQMGSLDRRRMCEIYRAALRSFRQFCRTDDLPLGQIDSDLMLAYEAYLKRRGVCMNTSSFYMRNLRAIYNRAVEKELVEQRNPFKHVYTGVDKTLKRAITLDDIRRLRELEFSTDSMSAFARDMFLFSFYTRGMSFVDMAFLRKSDLAHGVLAYRRKKTGQQLVIKWEPEMQSLIERYDTRDSPYLLPIITKQGYDERLQYQNMSHVVNRQLKGIGRLAGIKIPLTMYVARHSWASIARCKHVPLSIISDCMGHDSEATTQIYLSSLDSSAIDQANSLILKSL